MKTKIKLRRMGHPEWEIQLMAKDLKNGNIIARLMAKEAIRSARAACLAMLRAWPGSYSLAENDSAVIRDVAAIILPLTQESGNE